GDADRIRLDKALGGVDAANVGHEHGGIALPAQDAADRPGHVGGRERRRRHLVEQRLETMMVLLVDDDDVGRRGLERVSGFEPAETGARDDDAGTFLRHRPCSLAHARATYGLARLALPIRARRFSYPRSIR